MTSTAPAAEYRFAGYRLDVNSRKLFAPDGQPLQISSRAFDTLTLLVQHAGETVSKNRLMKAVWPDVVVEQNNLNQAISSIRKCLSDSTSAPRFIQTIPGRGYRFISPVDTLSDAASSGPRPAAPHSADESEIAGRLALKKWKRLLSAPLWRFSAASLLLMLAIAMIVRQAPVSGGPSALADERTYPVLPNSLAVIPFEELNPPTDDGLFAVALHDEIIHQLAQVKSLRVVSRENALALAEQSLPIRELGRLLRVESALTGTILYVGDRAKIRLQMLAPENGIVMWASSYEIHMDNIADLLAIQADIATNVAAALETEITARERDGLGLAQTHSFEAYRYLLAAKNAYYFQDYAQTWSLSKQAIALDESYIDAHYYFSYVNVVLTAVPLPGMTSEDHFNLAMRSAEKIVEVAPSDNRGYCLRAAAFGTRGDWQQVTQEVERLKAMGIALSEMRFYAPILLSLGDFEGAIEILEANLMLEPVNLHGRGFLMAAYEMAGQPHRARREYLLGEELNPIWWGDTVNVFLALGRNEPLTDLDQLPIPQELRMLLENLDDREHATRAVADYHARTVKTPAESIYYSAIASRLGQYTLAMDLMRDAVDEVWLSLHWVWLPIFDEMRQLPSFRELLIDAGIVAHWDRHGWPPVCRRTSGDDEFQCDWRAYDSLHTAVWH